MAVSECSWELSADAASQQAVHATGNSAIMRSGMVFILPWISKREGRKVDVVRPGIADLGTAAGGARVVRCTWSWQQTFGNATNNIDVAATWGSEETLWSGLGDEWLAYWFLRSCSSHESLSFITPAPLGVMIRHQSHEPSNVLAAT